MLNTKKDSLSTVSKKQINHSRLTAFLIFLFLLAASFSVSAQCEVGSPAPDFTLSDLDGQTVQLSQFKNQQNYILLSFLQGGDSQSLSKLEELVSNLNNCNPLEKVKIIAVLVSPEDGSQDYLESYKQFKERVNVPITYLIEEGKEVLETYQIEGYPTIILLRDDLCVRRIYSKFTAREEKAFYQYLTFVLTCQKESSSGCDDGGVCPPPPGY